MHGKFRAERSGEHAPLWREVIDGLHLAWHNPLLRTVIIEAPLVNFALSGAIFTITLALRRAGTAPGTIGLTQAGVMVGGLAGAVIAPRLQGRLRLWQVAIAISAGGTVLLGAAAMVLPRVNSTVIAAATGLAALAPLTSGLLVEHASGRWAMAAFTAAIGIAAIRCIAMPGYRTAEGSTTPAPVK